MTFTFITKGTWSSGSSITTGTIDTTDYDFLKITVYVQGSASGMKSALRFNGDTGSNSNYTFAITNDGSSGGGYNDNTADNFQLTPAGAEGGGTGNRQAMFSTIDMQNIDGYEKLIFSKSVTNDTTGASVIHMITSDGKWKTTSGKVTSIEVMNFGSSGNFTSDDYITVWGSKGDTVSDEKTTLADATVTTSPTPTPTSSGGTVSLTSGGSNVMATTALGFTASNTWVLRFSTVFTDYDANSYWNACLSSSDGNTATAQNYLGCLFRKDGSQNFGVHDVSNGSAPNSVNSSPQQAFTNDSSSTYYWEIIRQGATSCKVNFYGTDSTYGTVTSSSEDTSVANATGLNRIKFMSDASTNNTGSITIGNVKFYNGITAVTSTTTSLAPPANTRYEEIDTRKIYRRVIPSSPEATKNYVYGTSQVPAGANATVNIGDSGTKMYLASNSASDSQKGYQYTLSTAYDVSTASYASKSYQFGSQSGDTRGMKWKNNGIYCYKMSDQTGNKAIYRYTASTAWDISTLGSNQSYTYSSVQTGGKDMDLSSDGLKMYALADNATIYQYTLSTAWQVSSGVSSASKSHSCQSQDNAPRSFQITNSGTKLRYLGSQYNKLYTYTLSTAWDISTANYDGADSDIDCNTFTDNPYGVWCKDDFSWLAIGSVDSPYDVQQFDTDPVWKERGTA